MEGRKERWTEGDSVSFAIGVTALPRIIEVEQKSLRLQLRLRLRLRGILYEPNNQFLERASVDRSIAKDEPRLDRLDQGFFGGGGTSAVEHVVVSLQVTSAIVSSKRYLAQ